MTTFQKLARAFADAFETSKRADGATFYRLKDSRAGWMQDAVREAHDGELPDDWRYETCSDLAERIAEYEDSSDARDAVSVMADTITDVYTSELLRWYADNLGRLEYAEDAKREWGAGETILDNLLAGQAYCVAQMANVLIQAIEDAEDATEEQNDE